MMSGGQDNNMMGQLLMSMMSSMAGKGKENEPKDPNAPQGKKQKGKKKESKETKAQAQQQQDKTMQGLLLDMMSNMAAKEQKPEAKGPRIHGKESLY